VDETTKVWGRGDRQAASHAAQGRRASRVLARSVGSLALPRVAETALSLAEWFHATSFKVLTHRSQPALALSWAGV
jgi:hypothetical protein